MFKTVINQQLITDLPLQISTVDYLGDTLLILAKDGSLLKFKLSEEPFEIELTATVRNYLNNVSDCLLLPTSKSVLFIRSGQVYSDVLELSNSRKLEPIPNITDARCFKALSFNEYDLVLVGAYRCLWVLKVDSQQCAVVYMIALKTTPRYLDILNQNQVVVSGKSVLLVDLESKSITSIFDVKESILMKKSVHQAILHKRYGTLVELYCSKSSGFYKLSLDGSFDHQLIFNWTSVPIKCCIQEYYVIGLYSTKLEVKSLKTGTTLESISTTMVDFVNLPDLLVCWNANSVNRIFSIDFDDQIDDLLNSHKFEQAEILLNELEFETEQERVDNLVKVKGAFAQYLFGVGEYEKSISVLEGVNASPLDVLELYPDVLGNDDSELESSSIDALLPLSQYLTKQRAKLQVFRKDITQQDGLNFAEMQRQSQQTAELLLIVETSLLKVLIRTNSPLLKPLLRLELSTSTDVVVQMLKAHTMDEELVEYYKARGLHREALEFICEKGDMIWMFRYLTAIKISENLELVLKYALIILERDQVLALKVISVNRYLQSIMKKQQQVLGFLFTFFCMPTI